MPTIYFFFFAVKKIKVQIHPIAESQTSCNPKLGWKKSSMIISKSTIENLLVDSLT